MVITRSKLLSYAQNGAGNLAMIMEEGLAQRNNQQGRNGREQGVVCDENIPQKTCSLSWS